MRRLARLALALALLAAAALGCGVGRQVKKATDCYKNAHYQGALCAFEDLECCEHEMNPKALVRYLVYRGLTHYRLGQRDAACYFLERGEQVYLQGRRRWLRPIAVLEMQQALADLRMQPRVHAEAVIIQ